AAGAGGVRLAAAAPRLSRPGPVRLAAAGLLRWPGRVRQPGRVRRPGHIWLTGELRRLARAGLPPAADGAAVLRPAALRLRRAARRLRPARRPAPRTARSALRFGPRP